ncbi:MAG: TonB-dependent receptor, plug [Verrucomicrobia bacterium]|nr:TonB-dependent receptor, plug [Verrucomicrobiota bacterium]
MATGYAAGDSPAGSLSTLKKLSMEELMDVEVTSVSRHAEKLLDAASAIQVITGEEIRRSGALTLPEALRLADNLDVAQKDSHDWGISARGFNTELANKLLVMIDGRTVYTPLFSGVVWNVQDYLLEDLDRIEVISGPGGTLWGANAVNGVINVTTKSAKATQGLYLEGGTGSELPGFVGFRYGSVLAPNVYFRVYGKYFDRGNEVITNGSDAHDQWTRGQGGFRIDAETAAHDLLVLQGDYYGGRDELLAGGEDKVSGGNLLGRWSRTLTTDSDISLQLYYDRTHLSEPVAAYVINGITFAPAGRFEDDLTTYDLDFQYRLSLGSIQHVVWGLGYRFTDDKVHNAPALAFLPAELNHNLFSGFVQDEIQLAPKFSVTLGSKFEHNDYTGTEIEPGVRAQWNFADNQMAWSAVSRAVRTPSRIDRDLSQPGPPNFLILRGSPDFTSEIVVAYELGYHAQLSPKTSLSISTFYNEYDDVRSTSITPATLLPFYFANNLEGETHGLEFTADFHASPSWRLHFGYRLLKESLRIKPGQFDLNNALNEVSDPAQQFSLRSSFDLPGNLELDAGLRWVDERPGHNGTTVGTLPSYAEADVRLAWHLTAQLELALVGQNLLHDQHPEYGYPSPARGEIQRRVYGKVAWRY